MNQSITKYPASIAMLAAFLFSGLAAQAADVQVLTAGAMFEGEQELAAAFSKESGNKVTVANGSGGQVRDKVKAGEHIDLVILPAAPMDDLAKQGLVKSGKIAVGRATMALAVHKGAPTPDISTKAKFIAVLKSAKSIAYSDPKGGSTFGIMVEQMLKQPDFAGVKAVAVEGGSTPAMAKGAAEMAIQPVSEILPVEGASLVGRVPAELHQYVDYYAAVSASAASPKEAEAFLKYMTGAKAQEVWRKKGVDEPKSE